MRETEQSLGEFLGKNGLKFTPERRAVLACVSEMKGHFDPEALYSRLKDGGGKASRASVYRSIPILLDCGIIREAFRDKNGIKYENSRGKGHHDHMECVKCGKVIEFMSEEIEKLQDSVSRKYGFVLTGHRMELKGLCGECSRKSQKSSTFARGVSADKKPKS